MRRTTDRRQVVDFLARALSPESVVNDEVAGGGSA
jgi:hypothetical protein